MKQKSLKTRFKKMNAIEIRVHKQEKLINYNDLNAITQVDEILESIARVVGFENKKVVTGVIGEISEQISSCVRQILITLLMESKTKALTLLTEEFCKVTEKVITVTQVKKLLNNMKTALKRKTDLKTTGNKVIKLKDWEKDLLTIMNKEENPIFSKVPGALSVGVKRQSEMEAEKSQSNPTTHTDDKLESTASKDKVKIRKTKDISTDMRLKKQRICLCQNFNV
ncbi:unnamed protein product [Psylliodes chrysocephalus]|uniref:Uncharacterized protein n=1 Tax=Psylliodes chrysocephalus TaxID=3402493 RepID=A0A9P0GCZ3_9CUCU|nr:unnamed protein product [Psylliodes chrysocephala]